MEAAGEGDDLDPVGVAPVVVILARHLDREFGGLGAGIGEEHRIGEGGIDQFVGERLLPRNLVKVRDVPKLVRLRGQCADQIGVCMAQRVHRDARTQIEVSVAAFLDQPAAFAFDEVQFRTRIGRQNGRDHSIILQKEAFGCRKGGPVSTI